MEISPDALCASCGHAYKDHTIRPVIEQGVPLYCLASVVPGAQYYHLGCACQGFMLEKTEDTP